MITKLYPDLADELFSMISYAELPLPEREFRFDRERRWRFDLAWPTKLLAVECEGGTWVRGAHSRGKHFESDCEKYNVATLKGWHVLRFTTDQIKSGKALKMIDTALHLFPEVSS